MNPKNVLFFSADRRINKESLNRAVHENVLTKLLGTAMDLLERAWGRKSDLRCYETLI